MEEKKEEILGFNEEQPNNEKKSSLVGVLLMIVVIIGLMIGAYYLLNSKDKEENENKNVEKSVSKWNGIYKKEGSNNQVLLFTEDGKIGSLTFAQEINVSGEKELFYSIQYEKAMTIDGDTMLKKDEEETIFTIEKDEESITIVYNGNPVLADGYKEFVGTYSWIRDVTSSSLDEFKK